jgi:hypothetical protein
MKPGTQKLTPPSSAVAGVVVAPTANIEAQNAAHIVRRAKSDFAT